jgi:hypothetical protein
MTESGWKLADLLVKALAVALISALVSIYGIRLEKTRKELARQDSRLDTLVEFACD